MKTVCIWCHKPLEVKDNYDDLRHTAVCSQGCLDAETLFRMFYSDEEHNRRVHYRILTRGIADG